ncbi:unnamed protein product [Triticum turgidum subsp. durum]|uniref:DYW domain-containing protein n=1 Tax=Triticum turgidum subsp. durum TaxID=4567 RepID=A0A9R1A339_TRITD|nr:unnamed protein product [Triticum turgidum subsp. durum]
MPPILPPPTPCAADSTPRPAGDAVPHRNQKPPTHRQRCRITTSSSSSPLSAARVLIANDPTPRAFSALFKAASSSSPSPSLGSQLHAQAVVRGFLGDGDNTILSTAVLNFYASCREPDLARRVFDRMARRNAVTWNALIKGNHGGGCVQELGGAVHAQVVKSGLDKDPFVGASLVSMYAATGALEDVKVVFDDVDTLDPVVWSSMISAYINCKEEEAALLTFYKMLCQDIKPRQFVYSSLFAICGSMSMLEMGRQVHAHSLKNITDKDAAMTNALLTMYSDCGCIDDAWRVFESNDIVDVISYNSMILALGQHAQPKEAAELFRQMKFSGLIPDEVTLLNLLSAFNHAGLVHEGLHLFDSMLDIEGIKPTYQHYACVIDMLARSGEIEESMKTIKEMPFEAETSLWRIVLGACSKHGDIETGMKIAEMLFEMEPYEPTNYILLGNICARLGRWVEAEKVRSLMEKRGIDGDDAFSWIEMGQTTHKFGVDDRSHPISEEIYRNLDRLIGSIKAAGYVPDTNFATHSTEKDRREESLRYHCEKLAFAFGDLASPSGDTLRIMKNLRVCGDCHSAYKYFSLVTGRKIVLRDNHRFHHFYNGACSCGDYW